MRFRRFGESIPDVEAKKNNTIKDSTKYKKIMKDSEVIQNLLVSTAGFHKVAAVRGVV